MEGRRLWLGVVLVGLGGCLDTTGLTSNEGDGPSGADLAVPGDDGPPPDLIAVVDQAGGDRNVADLVTRMDAVGVLDQTLVDLVPPTCGVAGLPCCNGTTCSSGCCDGGVKMCVAVGAACSSASGSQVCKPTGACGACGATGQPCCASNLCVGGGCCATLTAGGNQCVASGASPPAQSGMVCSNGAIVHCGLVGSPCCPVTGCSGGACCDGNLCIGVGVTCASTFNACSASSCSLCSSMGPPCFQPCGGLNQACCVGGHSSSSYCTALDLTCVTSAMVSTTACVACGQPGQNCCPGNSCGGNGCCDRGVLLNGQPTCVASSGNCSSGQGACDEGGCAGGTCGKARQSPCGSGLDCTAALTIKSNGVCNPCGGLLQACCAGTNGGTCEPPFACASNSTCQLCGGNGQPCCPGSQCYGSTNKTCDVTSGTCL